MTWRQLTGSLKTPSINFFKHNKEAITPTRSHELDAGLDLYSIEDIFIRQGTTAIVKTGIAINVPANYAGVIWDRSSLASKGLRTGAGVIDYGYSGEIGIVLHNLTNTQDSEHKEFPNLRRGYQIKKGDKIAQLLLQAVEVPILIEVATLWQSDRADKGFGSSGK